MPITWLQYRCNAFDMEMETDALFGHLLACKTNDHLVSLVYDSDLPIRDLASTLPPFLQACRKLECLELFVAYPANGIDLLVQSWLEIRPESLEKVRINILEIQAEDKCANLMSLARELKFRGLNINVNLF
ncbi:hypothetical protein AVEN_66986-1 [Araneus ventricosus]|uniref:Uncharacterized protein n=1 Tax=Araneus ventricosus TaxID=182803 RepID=A0A4Y2SVV3_ARAVE|nr:hypothetical protein AVEN_66986-1 [Araneus ventricosus]